MSPERGFRGAVLSLIEIEKILRCRCRTSRDRYSVPSRMSNEYELVTSLQIPDLGPSVGQPFCTARSCWGRCDWILIVKKKGGMEEEG